MTKITDINSAAHSLVPSLFIRLLQLGISVYRKFVRDAGFARAGNLAFSTLMSAVPFAALIIVLLNVFGALDSVQDQVMDFILQMMIPTRQAEVRAMLEQFLSNSNALGVVGLVFFALTSIMLLNSVNVNLNAVWGSRVKTNFISKFTTYASVIIFGTLLLAASTTLSSRFSFPAAQNFAVFTRFILKFAPFIFDFLVIMLLIGLVPSGRIQLRYLILVSFIGAVFWEILKYGFFNLSSWAIRMSVVYGTIAVVPIFLFWIYVIWMIILIAMETAWVLQHKNKAWMGTTLVDMTPEQRLIFGMELFMKTAAAYEYGDKYPTVHDLSAALSVSVSDVRETTDFLIGKGLLMTGGEDGRFFIPARSLASITVIDLINTVYGRTEAALTDSGIAMQQLELFYSAGIDAVDNCSISDILKEKAALSDAAGRQITD